jgi:hypothetical protein
MAKLLDDAVRTERNVDVRVQVDNAQTARVVGAI